MRIALVSLARRGGMVHFHAELVNALAKEAAVVAISAASVPSAYFSAEATRFTLSTGPGGFGSALRALSPASWYALLRTLRSSEADLVHVAGAHEWNPAVALLARGLHKPLIYTVHDSRPHQGAPRAMRLSNHIIARMADALVALTEHGRRQLLSQGFRSDKIFRIPHGVYTFFTRWRTDQDQPQKVILCFGRIEPYKGLDVLLAAFSQVRRILPSWRLVIAGAGRLPAAIRDLANGGVEVVNRYIADEEVASLMGSACLVVVPYTEATVSGVIATAYAFGRPVIASDVGGLNEMVLEGKTGLLVPPNDPDALARAITTLAADSRRVEEMSLYAHAMSDNAWGWRRIARQHLEMYAKVLAARQDA